jgi:threonine dehydratase
MLEAPYVGKSVCLKLESLQVTNSFKPRGTYIKLKSLREDEKKRGIITVSMGNHAQGVAYHAKKMSMSATIIMPEHTPFTKIEHTKTLGASVILQGETMEECRDFAMQLVKKHGNTFIHTFDDPYLIAGHGTVALEMLEDYADLDVIIVPIGGGGLSSGICIAAKAINSNIQILGVQTQYCSPIAKTLFPNTSMDPSLPVLKTLAESIAIKAPGAMNMEIIGRYLDDMLIVSEDDIARAIELLALEGRMVVEGGGACGVAAFLFDPNIFNNRKVGIVVSGGNIDAKVFANLIIEGSLQSGHLVKYRIELEDSAGILGNLSQIITKQGGSIFEISHQRIFNENAIKMAYAYALVETKSKQHAIEIQNALMNNGFPTYIIE